MVRGKMPLVAAAVVLAGLGLTASTHAAFPPLKIIPPTGLGGQKEVDPPPMKTPCDPPKVHSTPEPGTLALAVMGAGALAAWKRRRASKAA
jgi:PEP-CTERM motif